MSAIVNSDTTGSYSYQISSAFQECWSIYIIQMPWHYHTMPTANLKKHTNFSFNPAKTPPKTHPASPLATTTLVTPANIIAVSVYSWWKLQYFYSIKHLYTPQQSAVLLSSLFWLLHLSWFPSTREKTICMCTTDGEEFPGPELWPCNCDQKVQLLNFKITSFA